MAKKRTFKFEENFATKIFRIQYDNKDFIAAHYTRRYSDEDVETIGPGDWIGLTKEPIYRMITDTDKESNTFGERIRDPDQDIEDDTIKTHMIPNIPFTAKSAADFRKLVGHTTLGKTKLIYKFREVSVSVPDEDEFWKPTVSMKDIFAKYAIPTMSSK